MDGISKFFLLGILLTILLSIKYIYDAIINKEWSDLFLLLIIFPIFNLTGKKSPTSIGGAMNCLIN